MDKCTKTFYGLISLLLLFIILFSSCRNLSAKNDCKASNVDNSKIAVDTLPYSILGNTINGHIVVYHDVDLKGGRCYLPEGIGILFRGGRVRNGILIGNRNKIEGKRPFFDRIKIQGIWNVHEISSNMFVKLDYDNSLRDVIALSNPSVNNIIIIEEGYYKVRALKDNDTCLPIYGNTTLCINGIIKLAPNDYGHYNIISAKGRNIKITGKGTIIGDLSNHTGTTGEWGMGIRFHGAKNASVKGLTIRDCWGDCVYVGGSSKNIVIKNCKLDHGRRQGISITKADGVTIRHCEITNVGGTNPQYAIDIEPNRHDSIDNVQIENVTVRDCEGGFLATRSMTKKEGSMSWIGKVEVRNCNVMANSKTPMRFKGCESLIVENSQIEGSNHRSVISTDGINRVTVKNNIIRLNVQNIATMRNLIKKVVEQGDYQPISIKRTDGKVMINNNIIEKL